MNIWLIHIAINGQHISQLVFIHTPINPIEVRFNIY